MKKISTRQPALILLCLLLLESFCLGDTLRVHFIDVGFGDAILVELPGDKAVMVDAGERFYGKKLKEYLQKHEIQEIDKAILTHPHKNHFGGFLEILKSCPVKNFYYNGDERAVDEGYDELLEQIDKKVEGAPRLLQRGDVIWQDENLTWEVLSPEDFVGSTNDNSLVSVLNYGQTSIAFTADVEPVRFNSLMKEYPQIQRADILQIPHHGLDIARIDHQFLRNKIWIVSVKENDVSRPALQYLSGLDLNKIITAREGDIVLESDGKNFRVVEK